MLTTEAVVRKELWSNNAWRRLKLKEGLLLETGKEGLLLETGQKEGA